MVETKTKKQTKTKNTGNIQLKTKNKNYLQDPKIVNQSFAMCNRR